MAGRGNESHTFCGSSDAKRLLEKPPPSNALSGFSVSRRMTNAAEGDQVLFSIVTRMAAKFLVVDFQVRHGAARLTSPAIATQDLLAKIVVRHRIQPQSHGL
jgi:hypothetical protein